MSQTTTLQTASGAPPRSQQDELPPYVGSLLRPEAYPHPADDLRLHETHISWVVLAGSYAYKVKKPVDFGFLDFSTPDAVYRHNMRTIELGRGIDTMATGVHLHLNDLPRQTAKYEARPAAKTRVKGSK